MDGGEFLPITLMHDQRSLQISHDSHQRDRGREKGRGGMEKDLKLLAHSFAVTCNHSPREPSAAPV